MGNKIKQQKKIQKFLYDECGEEEGNRLFMKQSTILAELIEQMGDKTKSQQKVLDQTIDPRIALYKVFLNEGFSREKANEYMKKYMLTIIAAEKHSAMLKMEMFPGFYYLYSSVFLKIMRTTDLQISTQEKGNDYYDVTITKCLWHTACVESGCGELCRLFCDVDDITYGNLEKIGFTRTQTIGYGGECCDFHFNKKLSNIRK